MMSVFEYANDMNKDVLEVIKMCGKLGISASSEDDMLDDDAIVELDNAFENLVEDTEVQEDEEINKIKQ